MLHYMNGGSDLRLGCARLAYLLTHPRGCQPQCSACRGPCSSLRGGTEFGHGRGEMSLCGDEGETKVIHGVLEVGVGEAWTVVDGDERANPAEEVDFVLRLDKERLSV